MAVIDLAPMHDIAVGDLTAAAEFASDGRLYVEFNARGLNLWRVLVYYWPEALGALLLVLVLLLIAIIARVRSRPQSAGMAHCRRCNYELSGIGAGRSCPECATDPGKVRPVRGRTFRRRIVLPGVLVALAGLGYAALHLAGVRRVGFVGRVFDWNVPRLTAYAEERKVTWLTRHAALERALAEIDLVNGRVSRTIRRLGPTSAFHFSISPDGRTAVTTLHDGELAAIELSSGRIVRSIARLDGGKGAGNPYGAPAWRHVAGWIDADSVCVQFITPSSGKHGLYRWDIDDGRLTPLADIPVPSERSPGIGPGARLMYLVPGSDPLLACEVPPRHSEEYGRESTIRVRDLSKHGEVVQEIRDRFWTGAAPVFAEGTEFFCRSWRSGSDIGLWEMNAGEARLGGMQAPGFMGTLQDGPSGLAYHAPTKRLFVATTSPDAVHVRDTGAKRWVARLTLPAGGLPDDFIAVSADGRWVAEAATIPGPAAGGTRLFHTRLLVFDLKGVK